MSFALGELFPAASQGLAEIGFLFGAGSSVGAGYPLMGELTSAVLSKLTPREEDIVDSLVAKAADNGAVYQGKPNIEVISDLIEDELYGMRRDRAEFSTLCDLRGTIREGIVEALLEVKTPDLKDHICFFSALGRLCSNAAGSTVWIFTLNYDPLFELAAAMAGVPLDDGFRGTIFRYFDLRSLGLSTGTLAGGRKFFPCKGPAFHLIKLHGSLDWWKTKAATASAKIYSCGTGHPDQVGIQCERAMVLPRRTKVRETLEAPYAEIFRFSEGILGSKCKYIVTCGYSFGDEHINDTLLLPKARSGAIRLTAFVKEDPVTLETFKEFTSFACGTETVIKRVGGTPEMVGTDLWRFESLVGLLSKAAGL